MGYQHIISSNLLFVDWYCLSPPQTSVGQVSRVDVSSKVEVVWADNSLTIVLPQVKVYPTNNSVSLLLLEVRCLLLMVS